MSSQIIELRYQPINKNLFLFGKLQQMDIESMEKGRQSKQSYSSGRQSYLSLEALTEPRLSLRQKTSLIEIMDLQVNRNSYRKSGNMMIEQSDGNLGVRLSDKSGQNYSFKLNMEEKDLNRKSNYKINHECSCQDYENHCNGVHCICFLTPRQICVIGQCCPKCIESKNNFLRETRGWQPQGQKKQKQTHSEENLATIMKQKNSKNMHYLKQLYSNDPSMQNITFCTCKKSHCQKKYCLCYEKGVKCSQFCTCIECLNVDKCEYQQGQAEQQKRWQRYATYSKQQQMPAEKVEEDIDYFLHQQLQNGTQFNQTMEFQPVNFENVLSNNNQ